MLNPEDRNAIEGLFERLRDVEGRTGPRDADAEALIARRIAENPGAPYYMAQTILVQETALREARERIAMLEERTEAQDGPWDRQRRPEHRESGGFLAGAAQTALGVTGGVLLGSAIASLFTGDATAAEPEAPVEPEPPAEPEDPAVDEGGWGDGDWGDFDMGGGF